MTKALQWVGMIACALLATILLTAPARAQTAPPPQRHNVDQNGVDVVLGTFNLEQTVVSIGPSWPHGLSLRRTRTPDGWTTNLRGGIQQQSNEFYLSVGNTSRKFVYSGGSNLNNSGTFTTEEGDGATLTRSGGIFTMTDGRGVVTRYTAEIDGTTGAITPATGRLMDIRYPQGAVVSLNYRTVQYCEPDDFGGTTCRTEFRLQSVSNNFDYQIRYHYERDEIDTFAESPAWHNLLSVTAINASIDPCDTHADQCTYTRAWPTASFGTDSGAETVTLADGGVWRFAPVSGGFAVRRPGSTVDDILVDYDGSGRVESVTGASGQWTYSYGDSGTQRTTSVSGPLSASRTVVSDWFRQIVLSDENALGRTTSYQYDSEERLTRVTADEGNYVQITYDARGNATERRAVAKPGSGLPDIVATADYPASCTNPVTCNLPTSTTDEGGQATDFTYDSTHGGVLTITAPAPAPSATRPQVRISYTNASVGGQTVHLPNGTSTCRTQASCTNGADEVRTSITYSGDNFLPTSISAGNGTGTMTATRTIGYDAIGNTTSVDGPLSGAADTVHMRYDALRRMVGSISPDPDGVGALDRRAVRIEHDSSGLVTEVATGTVEGTTDTDWQTMTVLERLETERDARGRPTHHRLIGGTSVESLVQIGYDARGRTDCVAQRMNPAEYASLPADACTPDTAGTHGPDRITRNEYDAASQVTAVRVGVGVMGTNQLGVVEESRTYTANGRLHTLTDGEANRTTYEYDGHDRTWRVRYPVTTQGANQSAPTSGTGADYEELTYATRNAGALGTSDVASIRLRDGQTIAYTHDLLGRVTGENRPGTEPDVTYAYDLLGRLTGASLSTGHNVSIGYDALGRVTSEGSYVSSHTSQYDLAGRRTRLTWSDGFYVDYDHLVTGEVTAIRENGATSGIGVLATFGYDQLGRRTSLTRGNGTSTSYGYDAVSRLDELVEAYAGTTHDVTRTFGHNPAGQIVQATRSIPLFAYDALANLSRVDTHNGLNQILLTGGVNVTHDARGNITGDGTRSYTYDSLNRLTQSGGPSNTSLSYDALGRMMSIVPGGANHDYPHHDGWTIISEYSGSAVLRRRYVHGPGIDEPLVWYEGSGTSDRRWLHADERGSIVALSNDSGAVTAINAYDEYGVPDGTITGRFGYTGQAWLPTIGIYHYRYRNYHPALGRFMQPDPIGYAGGLNLYAYVGNDPVNFIDPLGLDGCTPDTWVCGDRDRMEPHSYFDNTSTMGGGGGYVPPDGLIDIEDANCPPNCESVIITGARYQDDDTSPNFDALFDSMGYSERVELACWGPAVGICARILIGLLANRITFHIGAHIAQQMVRRGWTRSLIRDALRRPARTVSVRDTRHLPNGQRMNESATAYYSRRGGYVVRNDRTGDIVQISNRSDPGWRAPWD